MELEREMHVTAYVTVTIPVGLAFDGPVPWDELKRAALENFLDHPAIRDKPNFGNLSEPRILGYLDRIEVEHG